MVFATLGNAHTTLNKDSAPLVYVIERRKNKPALRGIIRGVSHIRVLVVLWTGVAGKIT